MSDPLAPYKQHGVTFQKIEDGQASGTCPWCARRPDSKQKGVGKFAVRGDGEVWCCVTCPADGNLQGFFARVVAQNAKVAAVGELQKLSEDRGGLEVKTLRAWSVGWGGAGYTYPAWVPSSDGKGWVASDARRYKVGGKAFSSSGGHAGLMHGGTKGTKVVWVCEGEWDGMALWEALRGAGIADDVVAVPGAATLPAKCLGFFQRKDVVFCYDNDAPGQAGQEGAWGKVAPIASSIKRIKWPAGIPDGFDVRDLWMQHGRDPKRATSAVIELLTSEPYPSAKGSATATAQATSEQDRIDPDAEGAGPKETLRAYRKWLELDQPEMLDVIFGSVLANRMDIDPLWLFVVAPPGGGKSELLMSLSSCPMVHCSTGLTSHTLISGMNIGGQDPSLIPKLIGRTWIVKDFTTVLALNQLARDEIFSVLRDAYDGRVEKPFGNNVTRKYEGRFGIVAGVTNKIDSVTAQNAVLGERFIRWRSRHKGRVLVGAEIIMRALDNLTGETEMREDLRKAARRVLDRAVERKHYPKIPLWFKQRVIELAQWVSSMRGVVERDRFVGSSSVISSKPSAELGTRLAKQFCTLGMGIGVYRKLEELDEEVYAIIAAVGRDTCPDRVEEVVRSLYAMGGEGQVRAISDDTRFPGDTVRWVLQDLDLLGLVRRRKGVEGVYALADSTASILKRLKLYDADKAWRKMRAGVEKGDEE